MRRKEEESTKRDRERSYEYGLPEYLQQRIGVGISDVETIGIDTPEDLAAAEEFLKRMKR